MTHKQLHQALQISVQAALHVGHNLRRHLHLPKTANEITQHDIKLELDVASQRQIERTLTHAFPHISVLGEEGVHGDPQNPYRWVVDPIDGTVNFNYGVPHACVSIALQHRPTPPPPKKTAGRSRSTSASLSLYEDGYQTLIGVVYDPFCDELWTAIRGRQARLNRRIIRVSSRSRLAEAIVTIGFAKTRRNLQATLPYFNQLVHRVRKIRIMGAAALALTYVASGRFDAYIERGIRLWDIAAGGLILECAGGSFRRETVDNNYTYRLLASNTAMKSKFKMPAA